MPVTIVAVVFWVSHNMNIISWSALYGWLLLLVSGVFVGRIDFSKKYVDMLRDELLVKKKRANAFKVSAICVAFLLPVPMSLLWINIDDLYLSQICMATTILITMHSILVFAVYRKVWLAISAEIQRRNPSTSTSSPNK